MTVREIRINDQIWFNIKYLIERGFDNRTPGYGPSTLPLRHSASETQLHNKLEIWPPPCYKK